MFGYVKPFKPEMKIKEFDIYNSVYCGLCKDLSKIFGRCSNVTLSYDFTFLSLLGMSIDEDSVDFNKKRCSHNFLKKKMCCNPNKYTSLSSNVAMIMLYFKIKDDIFDSSFFKKIIYYLIFPFSKRYMRKAKKQYPEIYDTVENLMQKQNDIEKTQTTSLDLSADNSALTLKFIFSLLSQKENEKQALELLGYHIGRFIYFCDALNDIEEDLKQKSFNPFITKFKIINFNDKIKKDVYEYGKNIINMSLGEIANAYVLIDIKRFKPILDNIIYLGMSNVLFNIINKEKVKNQKESNNGRSI